MSKLHGLHLPHHKRTSEKEPIRLPIPAEVFIPMSMHIGAPAKPIVEAGSEVKVGQIIGEPVGFVSSPVHASVSGKVKRLEERVNSAGKLITTVVITSDGKQALYEGIKPPEVHDRVSFLAAVRDSGIVGLGGAGFPTAVKLSLKEPAKLETLIINGAECEPFITSDTRVMLDDTSSVWEGLLLLQKYLAPPKIIFAIEKNKPLCIAAFKSLANKHEGVEVMALPSVYPQGGEKVLIYNTTRRIVPEGGLPIDVGAVVINSTTLASIARFIKTGMPLVEKCVTVDGSAVRIPQNVIAPIGTPLQELFDFCGGFVSSPHKILYGGPMMGISVPDLAEPVLKITNAALAFDEKDAVQKLESPCIRCGRCIENCPLGLMPAEIETAFKKGSGEDLELLKVNLCMECGCCSYVCPARRHLVQMHKLAKVMLKNHLEGKSL
ncbi:MAG TPA: electron transport complex subunit RsxC [Clostridia bacterium]|nr:electron transport complex subunit RsxC [Clostridia bacterium]